MPTCRPNVVARNLQRGHANSLPRIPAHRRAVWLTRGLCRPRDDLADLLARSAKHQQRLHEQID